MDFRVVVFPVHVGLWKVVDSAHPQFSIEYADRQDAIDCARGLATEQAPSIVEVLSNSGRVSLREHYARTPDGLLRIEEAMISEGMIDDRESEALRSTG